MPYGTILEPIRQRRVKSEYKPWLTNEIKQMSYRRDYLKKQSIKLRSAYYDNKRCKNKLNNLIKETKQEYFRDKLSNAKNSKESWRTINELLNKKPETSEVKELDINGQLITDDDKIADAFNQYFSTIGSTLSDKITGNCTDPMNFVTPLDGSIFNFTSITLQETIDALNEIKTKKSPGLDETTKANLFADDTSLSWEGFSPYEIEIKLNKDIENVHRWLTANKLSLNMKKSEFMIIGSRRRLASIENSPCKKLNLLFVGTPQSDAINCITTHSELVITAAGNEIKAWKRGKE
ncbi:Hypothetical predicted protein, partial [Paramuricea clavata]